MAVKTNTTPVTTNYADTLIERMGIPVVSKIVTVGTTSKTLATLLGAALPAAVRAVMLNCITTTDINFEVGGTAATNANGAINAQVVTFADTKTNLDKLQFYAGSDTAMSVFVFI